MENKEKNFVSAVVYVYNEEQRAGKFLQMVFDVMEKNFEHSEIICVNDCSADSSVEVIRRVAQERPHINISVLNMSYFHGRELAMNAGLDLAIGDFVFEFDMMDAGYGGDEVMAVYKRSLEGYDVVSAVPDRKGKLTSKYFYKLFARFADFPYEMRTESFRVLSRRVINRIGSMNKTVPYRKALYANCGLKSDLLTYRSSAGESFRKTDKREKQYQMRLAVDTMILFTDVGYQFSVGMTILMMMMSVFMIGYSIFTYLVSHPVAGWTTTILFLSVAFFGLFGILTVVIKYLQLIVELIFKRKRYTFESIEKITK